MKVLYEHRNDRIRTELITRRNTYSCVGVTHLLDGFNFGERYRT